MSLTFENFKKTIDSTILQRGRQYFRDGQVIDLEEAGDAAWEARVQGSEVYEIQIEQDESGTLDCSCDCPYDFGPTCKHIAATLYAIEAAFPEYMGTDSKPNKPRKPRKTRAEKLREIVSKLSKEEMTALLLDLAKQNTQIARTIIARHSAGGADKKAYIQLVKEALRQGHGEYGYMDYWGATRAGRAIQSMLDQTEGMIAQGKLEQALAITQAVLETVAPALGNADDSNGDLGACIEMGIEKLEQIAGEMNPSERRGIFDYCLTQMVKQEYRDCDCEWGFSQIAANIVESEEDRARLFDQMGQQIGDWYAEYTVAEIKLTVIQRLDGETAGLTFIKEHIHLHQFRQMLIEYHINRNELKDARRLIHEWFEKEGGKLRGVDWTFSNLLLDIARREGNQEEVIRLNKELFIEGRNFDYYDALKKIVPPDQWAQTRDELIRMTGQARFNGIELQAEIYYREEMWEPLMGMVKMGGPHAWEHYRKSLEPHYPQEFCAIYEKQVYDMLKHTSSRDTYATAAEYLRRMIKLGQAQKAQEIIDLHIAEFSNRRAMVEELKKVRP
jgi:hypothetical protein